MNTGLVQENPWAVGPREFVLKYVRYSPWILISASLALIFAYIKIRYTVPIYHVQSSMLIKQERNNIGGGDKFNELMMGPQSTNLNNEIQVLRSTPIMERVAKDLDLQVFYYGIGKIRSTLLYPSIPFDLQILHIADSTNSFGLYINLENGNHFTVANSKTLVSYGEVFESNGNKFILNPNKYFDFKSNASNNYRIIWQPSRMVANSLIGSIRVIQPTDQSSILTLTYDGENTYLGKDVLNMVMGVYDSLVIEDKNRISNNTRNFIERNLDRVPSKALR